MIGSSTPARPGREGNRPPGWARTKHNQTRTPGTATIGKTKPRNGQEAPISNRPTEDGDRVCLAHPTLPQPETRNTEPPAAGGTQKGAKAKEARANLARAASKHVPWISPFTEGHRTHGRKISSRPTKKSFHGKANSNPSPTQPLTEGLPQAGLSGAAGGPHASSSTSPSRLGPEVGAAAAGR